jgi:hypothetical protein
MKLVVGITMTDRYCFAVKTLARAIRDNLKQFSKDPNNTIHIVFAGDGSEAVGKAVSHFTHAVPFAKVNSIMVTGLEFGEAYKEQSQLSIAKLEASLFDQATYFEADLFWSVEPDIIPPANAFRCLVDTLNFDNGYYDIAFATYPSQGGGSFLGGHGSPHRHIETDFLPEERELSEKYDVIKAKIDELSEVENPDHEKLSELHRLLKDELNKCRPKGNVFSLNANKWRRRGWFDFAYPGIGKGAIVPTDWVGMGCTLLSKKALSFANFYGYEGKGTQDLYLTWFKWHPQGLRSAVVSHCPCSHVCRERNADGVQDFDKLFLLFAYHEEEGEARGHLRMVKREFVDF